MDKNRWDISNKPHTRTKLEILRKVFDMWVTVWNGQKQQKWVAKEWYILDLFAGRGRHDDNKARVSGSPLIFLEEIFEKKERLKKNNIKIKLFFIEKEKKYFDELKREVAEFIKTHEEIKGIVDVNLKNKDCNKIITSTLKRLNNDSKHPLFILIDPWGLQIKKTTLEKIVELKNPKDIIVNYILEGVRRAGGVVKKAQRGEELNIKEIKTIQSFKDFLGADINIIEKSDIKILEAYISIFTNKGLSVVGYDMPYPDRRDVLYYLLFASKKSRITNIVKDIYHREKQKRNSQRTLFGDEYEKENIFTVNSSSKITLIKRKSLLYKTKVEYGDWTINHIIGCLHGCRFPCYAMMMAKRFGWIKTYDEWRKPKIAKNAMELLEQEIQKYRNEIDYFVHLCFMTDPFMYDSEEKDLVPEIKELTLKIIERLNKEGIKVNTLTKGFYPDEILDKKRFSPENEYGITLVSLNEEFKKEYEPYSAPYEKRIESLKKLANAGLKTWVSMEPYPPPSLPRLKNTGSENIEEILDKIKFVKKLVFGKLNYSRLSYYSCNNSSIWEESNDFYEKMVKKVKDFCRRNNIKCHIKKGTPGFRYETMNIFKE